MHLINKLIFNALASGSGINLPGVGALSVESWSAVLRSKGSLVSPYRRVMYSLDPIAGLPTIVELIEEVNGDHELSEGIFQAWLDETEIRGGMGASPRIASIEGVGTIKGTVFTASPGLDTALNPGRQAVIKVEPRRSGVYVWLAAVGVVALLAAAALFVLGTDPTAWSEKFRSTTVVQPAEVVALEPVVEEVAIIVDTVEVDSVETVVEQIVPQVVEPARYHLVTGVFSKEENAEKSVEQQSAKNPDLHYTVVTMGSKWIVSAFAASTEEQALQRKAELQKKYPEMWIYTVPQ